MFSNKQYFTSFNQIKSLCLFRLSAIGDILNLIPSLELVLKNYPHVEVTWIIGSGEYNLFKHLSNRYPQLKFVVFNKKKTSYFQAFKLLRNIQATPFDLLIHAQTSMRANVLASFIRAKEKVGFSWERSFEGHSLVINHRIPKQTSMHVMVDYFDLFKPYLSQADIQEFENLVTDTALLYSGNYPQRLLAQEHLKPLFDLGLGEPNSEQAIENISKHNISLYRLLVSVSKYAAPDKNQRDGRLIFVNPASSAMKKNWTEKGYVDLIIYLIEAGHRVVVTGGKNTQELNLVNAVAKRIDDLIYTSHHNLTTKSLDRAGKQVFFNLAGKTNLSELYLFMSLADLVISPDSGPMHLASCIGIPTIGLFAYINPLRSGPIQGVGDVISVFHKNMYGHDIEFTQEQYEQDLVNWRKKPHNSDDKLMRQINSLQVVEKVQEVLDRMDQQENVPAGTYHEHFKTWPKRQKKIITMLNKTQDGEVIE
ncbi:glycosyltransferase family 9 protein [Psittacicella hinzii]|uniref:Uncharacterized protein n=1 Tax=Psittacicella hinzii TaxID=2028575 RepID=A0A3A1YR27_9GAMM|nr:glycosyltransferase family 9 protein [Psittacicella hinzii]RIY40622.1 hypothetical protein CKF58_00450 [Psittacicella hinzii]